MSQDLQRGPPGRAAQPRFPHLAPTPGAFTQPRAAGRKNAAFRRALGGGGNGGPEKARGGGARGARRKGKAFLWADARSRGFLPTWALAIGRAAADVAVAARREARRGRRCVGSWRGARALPRPAQSPPSALGPPTRSSSGARLRRGPAPRWAGGARAARHVISSPASSSRSHIELELEEASPVSKWR